MLLAVAITIERRERHNRDNKRGDTMTLQVLQEPLDKGCQSGSCGSTHEQLAHLPEAIRKKVENHPCYSEKAHHYFARMHVAVAPACNIQCNYCNRKFDCSNESRPGVVSELLKPQQAVQKVKAVAAAIPQMTVLGIAGPGDPLANPRRTFETFRRLRQECPDIKLCVSTNGLALPEHIEQLLQYNIEHVTITINCLDPVIGTKIYPWIYWNHRRIKGILASKILIEQQQKGLELLVKHGILVKVNSVLIPGINDQHLAEVSRVVKTKGAFLHNIMPLIAEAEHGTYFGLTGQPVPSQEDLMRLQDSCSGDMNMMRHCRQCRADAVGLLGEDRGEEFTMANITGQNIDYPQAMKQRADIQHDLLKQLAGHDTLTPEPTATDNAGPTLQVAVASKGQGVINQHFGHAQEFLIYQASVHGVRLIGARKTDNYCRGTDECDDTSSRLEQTLNALRDCQVLLCAKVGYEPWIKLEEAGIQPNVEHAMEPIPAAVMAVYQEMLDTGKLNNPDDPQQQLA